MSYKETTKTAVILSFVMSCLCLASGPSLAQNMTYRIGPRDVLTLTIFAGGKGQQEVDLTVSARGLINVPFIGSVKADGLTPNELEEQITRPLAKDYFVDPKVNIRIKEYHSLHYYLSGAVKSPGLYETSGEITLLELIAKAGGVAADRGSIAYVMRTSSNHNSTERPLSPGSAVEPDWASGLKAEAAGVNHEPIRVDLRRLLDKGDMSANLKLEPGDVVYIPLQTSRDLAESKIYVEGEVKRPGIYDHQPGITAMNACIMAGGFDEFAAPNRARIIRQDGDQVKIIKINLNHVKDGKIPDMELKSGDRIHVPETWL